MKSLVFSMCIFVLNSSGFAESSSHALLGAPSHRALATLGSATPPSPSSLWSPLDFNVTGGLSRMVLVYDENTSFTDLRVDGFFGHHSWSDLCMQCSSYQRPPAHHQGDAILLGSYDGGLGQLSFNDQGFSLYAYANLPSRPLSHLLLRALLNPPCHLSYSAGTRQEAMESCHRMAGHHLASASELRQLWDRPEERSKIQRQFGNRGCLWASTNHTMQLGGNLAGRIFPGGWPSNLGCQALCVRNDAVLH